MTPIAFHRLLTLPKIVEDEARAPALPFNTWNPTVFACNMHTETKNVTLDARNGNISHTTNLSRAVRTTWEQWEQPQFINESNADPLTFAASIAKCYSSWLLFLYNLYLVVGYLPDQFSQHAPRKVVRSSMGGTRQQPNMQVQ